MAGEALSYVQPQGKGQRSRLLAVYYLPGHQHLRWWPFTAPQGVTMIFGRKPKPPLVLSMGMVSDAMELAYIHLRDGTRKMTEEELEQLELLAALLAVNGEITKYISRWLGKRVKED
jgi:hypothetical protein